MTQPRPTGLYPLSEQAVTLLQTPLRPLEVGGSAPVPDAQSAMPMANLHVATLGGQGPSPPLQPPGSQPLLSQAAQSPNVEIQDAPTKRKKSESFPGRVDTHGVLPTRTLIRSEVAFIEHHRHWHVTQYDPVSGAAWSTFFMSREVRAMSTFTETRFLPPAGQPPAFDAQPVGVPGEVVPQCPGSVAQGVNLHVPAIALAAAPQMIGYPTAHNYHVNTQAPPYHLPPGGAPQIETPRPGGFYGQPYPNPGPAVDPRFNY
ncbi:hypothetical protein V8D89_012561 [Ganoderma adspersum]